MIVMTVLRGIWNIGAQMREASKGEAVEDDAAASAGETRDLIQIYAISIMNAMMDIMWSIYISKLLSFSLFFTNIFTILLLPLQCLHKLLGRILPISLRVILRPSPQILTCILQGIFRFPSKLLIRP